MKKLFSLENLTQGIRLIVRRYPISILFAALAAFLLIVVTADDGDGLEYLSPYIPFICNFKINAFWQYNKSLFIRAFTTALYTGVLFAGISGAILAISELFDMNFGSKIYTDLWFIMALPMSVIIFCAGVPNDIDELESSTDLPKVLRIFVQFILIPLDASEMSNPKTADPIDCKIDRITACIFMK